MYHQAELLEDETSKAQLLVDSYEVCVQCFEFYLKYIYFIYMECKHVFCFVINQAVLFIIGNIHPCYKKYSNYLRLILHITQIVLLS